MSLISRVAGRLVWQVRRWRNAWQRGAYHAPPRTVHDGKQVSLFLAGKRYDFDPVTHGRSRGHCFAGSLFPDVPLMQKRLRRLGLPVEAARGLVAVSRHEGGFDSLQTYTNARLAWGFIQFTAAGGLPALLQRIAREQPALFEAYFARYGLACDGGGISLTRSGEVLRGREALDVLHGTPALWKVFVLAAQDEAIQDMQIKTAYEHYYAHILAQPVKTATGDVQLTAFAAGDAYCEAVFFDRAVELGMHGATQLFRRAARNAAVRVPADAAQLLSAAQSLDAVHQPRWQSLKAFFDAHPDAYPVDTKTL